MWLHCCGCKTKELFGVIFSRAVCCALEWASISHRSDVRLRYCRWPSAHAPDPHWPYYVSAPGKRVWEDMGLVHREGGPAVIEGNERRYYYYGLLHNMNWPAVQSPERAEWWLFNRRAQPHHLSALALILAERRAGRRPQLPPELWPLVVEAAVHVPVPITRQPVSLTGADWI